IYAKVRQKFHLSPLFKFPEPALNCRVEILRAPKRLSNSLTSADLPTEMGPEIRTTLPIEFPANRSFYSPIKGDSCKS
ncbi:hypothetical protein, partial [Sinorhizobium medicae]